MELTKLFKDLQLIQHDQTILPQISTIYNPLTEGKVDARIEGQKDASRNVINTPPYRGALPAVSNVQFFNMCGNNVPATIIIIISPLGV